MLKSSSIALNWVKIIYLGFFFALLSGLFYPLIEGGSGEQIIIAMGVLSLGLVGGLLVYKSSRTEKHGHLYLGSGFCILATALLLVFVIAGRI